MTRAVDELARHGKARVGECLLVCQEAVGVVPVGIGCATHGIPGQAELRGCALLERSGFCRALDRALVELVGEERLSLRERSLVHLQLALSPDPASRVQAARSPACPERVQELLVGDWWWEVRAALAANHHVVPRLQEHLAQDENLWVRRALAENRAATRSVVACLAHDQEFEVADAASEHPSLPGEVLVELAGHPVFEVRRSVAKRMDLPPEGAWRLLRDPSPWVRLFLAANPGVPQEVVARLLDDPALRVRVMARHRGDRWARLVNALAFGIGQSFEPRAVPPALGSGSVPSELPGGAYPAQQESRWGSVPKD